MQQREQDMRKVSSYLGSYLAYISICPVTLVTDMFTLSAGNERIPDTYWNF